MNLTQLALKAAILCEITRNYGHWAVKGQSRSRILVAIESLYATSYYYYKCQDLSDAITTVAGALLVSNTNLYPILHG